MSAPAETTSSFNAFSTAATVYLAHDIKHDRKVAIKVLKPELAAVLGAERFVMEIKTTASLQYPHILPLFDSGDVRGADPARSEGSSLLYYVMPYVQGETVREKLTSSRRTSCCTTAVLS